MFLGFTFPLNKGSKNILIRVMYRHPKSKKRKEFSNFNEVFRTITNEKKEILVCGDFNMDFLKYSHDEDVSEFLDIMLQRFLKLYILIPSFFTKSGYSSLIDNIFYSGVEKSCLNGNFSCPLADHLSNFLLIEKFSMDRKLLKHQYRDFKNFDNFQFEKDFIELELEGKVRNIVGVNDKCEYLFE